ncbi:MAG: SAM-dependent methyltransferase [Acidimicrobiia bacterium]|nr:SAM-dependent methyltransferase [Acidimicrobiia bacterium]
MTGRVTVVGLGPAGGDLVTPAARRALASVALPLTRTATHPAVADLAAEGIVLRALDAHYESATSLAATYAGIVDEVLDVAERDGEVVYSVPGNPAVAERTVALIRERLSDDLAEDPERLRIVAGLSFAELAWSRAGVDPQNGARLVDGHRFSTDAAGVSGPMLIAQCDRMSVLSEVKLTLLEILEPNTPVTVLQRLGSPDESVSDVALVDLDRVVEADPRTSVFVDTGEQTVAAEMAEFVALMARLRGPGGCPWDAEQTHRSLGRYVLEEAYEVVEAVQALPPLHPRVRSTPSLTPPWPTSSVISCARSSSTPPSPPKPVPSTSPMSSTESTRSSFGVIHMSSATWRWTGPATCCATGNRSSVTNGEPPRCW